MTGTPRYVTALDTAETGGLAGRINNFSSGAAAGAIPLSFLTVAASAFAGSPTMALASGVGGVGAAVLGSVGYAATVPRTRRNRDMGAEELRGFEPVDADEEVLDAVETEDIDTVRYMTNTGFRTKETEFVLDEETVEEEDAYTLLERLEEDGDPAYLLREDGYRFTLTAVNTPYWNRYSRDAMGDAFQACGNYETLEIVGDSRDGLGIATTPVEDEELVDGYVEATLA